MGGACRVEGQRALKVELQVALRVRLGRRWRLRWRTRRRVCRRRGWHRRRRRKSVRIQPVDLCRRKRLPRKVHLVERRIQIVVGRRRRGRPLALVRAHQKVRLCRRRARLRNGHLAVAPQLVPVAVRHQSPVLPRTNQRRLHRSSVLPVPHPAREQHTAHVRPPDPVHVAAVSTEVGKVHIRVRPVVVAAVEGVLHPHRQREVAHASASFHPRHCIHAVECQRGGAATRLRRERPASLHFEHCRRGARARKRVALKVVHHVARRPWRRRRR